LTHDSSRVLGTYCYYNGFGFGTLTLTANCQDSFLVWGHYQPKQQRTKKSLIIILKKANQLAERDIQEDAMFCSISENSDILPICTCPFDRTQKALKKIRM